MELSRIFTKEYAKGRLGYIDSQKKYEVIRTLIFFGISLSLFFAGWITTETKTNLLTIVAVLGFLPASKSAVGMILFLRYKSCPNEDAVLIAKSCADIPGLFDLVFTSYQKNFVVDHICFAGGSLCGYSSDPNFSEKECVKHLEQILFADGYKNIRIKIFTDLGKYIERVEQLGKLEGSPEARVEGVFTLLKQVSL